MIELYYIFFEKDKKIYVVVYMAKDILDVKEFADLVKCDRYSIRKF